MLDVIVHWHILAGLRFTCLNSPVVSGIQPAHAVIPIPRQGIALHIPIMERSKTYKSRLFSSALPASSSAPLDVFWALTNKTSNRHPTDSVSSLHPTPAIPSTKMHWKRKERRGIKKRGKKGGGGGELKTSQRGIKMAAEGSTILATMRGYHAS